MKTRSSSSPLKVRSRTARIVHPGLGRREQNKRDKIERITRAAAELFTEKGFDAATTREIAQRAGVGSGTLFNFANDKRDLIFLIFVPQLDRLAEQSFGAVDPRDPLLEQFVKAVSVFYREFAANPALARILLKELAFYDRGKLAAAYLRNRMRLIGYFKELVLAARRSGRVARGHDPGETALAIFFLFAGALRWWIASDKPKVSTGLAELRKFLGPYIDGLASAANRRGPAKAPARNREQRVLVFQRPRSQDKFVL